MINDEYFEFEKLKFKIEDEEASFQCDNLLNEFPPGFIELMDSDLREFVFTSAPKFTTVRCVINRYRPRLTANQIFYMYYEREDKKKVKKI
jgi:hypothetical protein